AHERGVDQRHGAERHHRHRDRPGQTHELGEKPSSPGESKFGSQGSQGKKSFAKTRTKPKRQSRNAAGLEAPRRLEEERLSDGQLRNLAARDVPRTAAEAAKPDGFWVRRNFIDYVLRRPGCLAQVAGFVKAWLNGRGPRARHRNGRVRFSVAL